jgi:hypothetical protein
MGAFYVGISKKGNLRDGIIKLFCIGISKRRKSDKLHNKFILNCNFQKRLI